MKLMRKTLLASAVATGMLANGAFAATVNAPSTASPQVYQQVIANETVRTVITQPVGTVVTLAAGEALNVDDAITFTLSGGATYASITNADLTLAPNVNLAAVALVAGGAGQNFATFRITTNNTDAGAALTLTAAATLNGAAVPDNADIQTTVTMDGFVGGVPIALFGSPLTSLSVNLTPMQTAAITPTGGIAGVFNVASGFQELTAATSTSGAAPFVASLAATVTVTDGAGAVAGATTGGVPAAVPTPANTIFTIKGPMTGVTSITTTGPVTSSTDTGGVPTGGTVAGQLFIDTANNAAYGIATGASPVAAPFIFNFDGTVAHDASVYTADVTRTADPAGYAATTVSTNGTLATFTRNGSAFTSNSLGPLNKVTVTDRSGAIGSGGADGAINITAYDSAGSEVTCTGLTIPNLTNNGTVTIAGTDLTGACTGVKRVEGIVNSTNIIVTNVKKTADGATATPGVSTAGAAVGI